MEPAPFQKGDNQMYSNISEELLQFIHKSPDCFHAVHTMEEMLEEEGYVELKENLKWEIQRGGKYFVNRNGSSLIAFTIPEGEMKGMRIIASHSDSPTFKIKENPEMESEGHYIKLNVERYGGMLCAPWFDRPLSISGRVIVKDSSTGTFVSKLVNIDRDLVMIPNLAIHMNREVNDGYKYNAQKDMLPIYGDITSKGTFMKTVAEAAGVEESDILGHDLFLYNRQEGTVWDCVLDNEEVGSGTKQGAASTFLYDTLTRVHESLGMTREEYLIHLADSFMISADNAHAVHPNYAEKADPVNRPFLNGGIVIKFNANQKYCTDGVSAAMFRDVCRQADVPVQTFTNRSDMLGGSTLGNISNTQVALNTVDIGLPQLAMHSPYETVGVKDTEYLIRAGIKFFS